MKSTSTKPGRLIVICVTVVCVAGLILILAIPAESLAVDLVYQGF